MEHIVCCSRPYVLAHSHCGGLRIWDNSPRVNDNNMGGPHYLQQTNMADVFPVIQKQDRAKKWLNQKRLTYSKIVC